MLKIIFIVIALFVLAVLPKLLLGEKKAVNGKKYKLKPIMTKNEIEFFHRLRRALPEYEIFPQVAVGALLDPLSSDAKDRTRDRNRINQKRIDYAVYSKQLEIICIVELDDRTHDANKDVERDRYFRSAGVRTIRWQSKNKPSVEDIATAIIEVSQSTFLTPVQTGLQEAHSKSNLNSELVESAV